MDPRESVCCRFLWIERLDEFEVEMYLVTCQFREAIIEGKNYVVCGHF